MSGQSKPHYLGGVTHIAQTKETIPHTAHSCRLASSAIIPQTLPLIPFQAKPSNHRIAQASRELIPGF